MTVLDKQTLDELREIIQGSIPQLSINCVIFRYYNGKLQIPIVQPISSDLWVIPGGYVFQNEDIDQAARRILLEQTQIDNLPLNQFGTFGTADRDFKSEFSTIENTSIPEDIVEWMSQRFVTVGYYSVLGGQEVELKASLFFKKVKWLDIENIDELDLDHSQLVKGARKVLSRDLLRRPLLSAFMPDEFTMPELHKLYEAILDRPIDRGNFRQRILKTNSLVKVGQRKEKSRKRPPDLYRLDEEHYLKSLSEDAKFGF